MFTKFARLDVLEVKSAPSRVRAASLAKFSDFNDYRTDDGYIYVRVRAISSRVNKNHDGWPSNELKKSYRTFLGKPIFVDHHNSDPKRARGVVVDAILHEEDAKTAALDPYYASAPTEHLPPTWIELLLEVDAKRFPKLASAIVKGDIDGVSMGANVERSKCSHCSNWATTPDEYCSHIRSKGALFDKVENGRKTSKKSYEDCYDIGFFELSFVFDPADETAFVNDIKHAHAKRQIAAGVKREGGDIRFEGEDPALEGAEPALDEPEVGDAEPKVDEAAQVAEWIRDQLTRSGFTPEQIEAAFEAGVATPASGLYKNDLINLVDQGATPDQAMRIVTKKKALRDARLRTKKATPEAALLFKQLRLQGIPTEQAMQQIAQQFFGGDLATAQYEVGRATQMTGGIKTAENPLPQAMMETAPDDVDTLRQEQVCPICFAPGTMVRTADGYVPIEEIEAGDRVVTSTGSFAEVLEVIESQFDGLLVQLDSRPFIEPILVTPEHPIKTLFGSHPRNKKSACAPGICDKNVGFKKQHQLGWACAEHLTSDSYVVANPLREADDLEAIDVPDQYRGRVASPRARHTREYLRRGPMSFQLTPEFLWLVGLYIAEGSAGAREITYSLHQDELEYVERIQTYFEEQGYSTRLSTKTGSRGIWVHVHSSVLAEWWPVWCGEGSANKRIPSELANLPTSKLCHVIDGIFAGDGTKKSGVIGQTSPRLARQLIEYGLRTNHTPWSSTESHSHKNDVVTVGAFGATVLERQKTQRGTWEFAGRPLYRLTEASRVPYWGPVYNLSVAGDHTYVVENILVHNCGSDMEDGVCEVCNYEEPPEGFDNPDLQKAKQVDQQMHDQDAEQAASGLGDAPNNLEVTPGGASGQEQGVGGAMPSTSKVRDAGGVINEKTSASGNGGRVNTQERPILPVTRKVTDKPLDAKTIQNSAKPVESKTRKENDNSMSQTTKTADGATPLGEGVQPQYRVDVEGVGGVTKDPLSGIEHENVEKAMEQKGGPATDTWSGNEGDSLGQHEPVSGERTDQDLGGPIGTGVSAKTAETSDDLGGPIGEGAGGAGSEKGGPTWDQSGSGFPDHDPARVDLTAPLKEEIGEGTKTFPADDFHITAPVTGENANEVGGPIGEAIKAPMKEHHPQVDASVRRTVIKAMRLAEAEQELGLTENKWDRLAELENKGELELDAALEVVAKVKTARAKAKTASTKKTAGATRMPSLRPHAVASIEIEEHSADSYDTDDVIGW